MPIYEYVCEPCETKAEALIMMGEAEHAPKCLECHEEMKRVMSAPANYFINGNNSASTRPRK